MESISTVKNVFVSRLERKTVQERNMNRSVVGTLHIKNVCPLINLEHIFIESS